MFDCKIKIEPDLNAERINKIMNHPEIFDKVDIFHTNKKIDLTNGIKENILISFTNTDSNGGIVYHKVGNGIYEVHPQFLKCMRGINAISFARNTFNYMFTQTPCVVIKGYVPLDYKHSGIFAVQCGFEYEREDIAEIENKKYNFKIYNLTYERWKNGWCS